MANKKLYNMYASKMVSKANKARTGSTHDKVSIGKMTDKTKKNLASEAAKFDKSLVPTKAMKTKAAQKATNVMNTIVPDTQLNGLTRKPDTVAATIKSTVVPANKSAHKRGKTMKTRKGMRTTGKSGEKKSTKKGSKKAASN